MGDKPNHALDYLNDQIRSPTTPNRLHAIMYLGPKYPEMCTVFLMVRPETKIRTNARKAETIILCGSV